MTDQTPIDPAIVGPALLRLGRSLPHARHQNGSVKREGKRVEVWVGYYYAYVRGEDGRERRRHRRVVLGPVKELKKWAAQDRLRKIVEAAAGTSGRHVADGARTLRWFVAHRYLPARQGRWEVSTRETNLGIINGHILPEFGDTPIEQLDRVELQMHLDRLAAAGLSKSVVQKVMTYTRSILDEATEMDYVAKNPARKLAMPRMADPARKALSTVQARTLLAAITDERDRLILAIAALCAMRPGEVLGLRWGAWKGDRWEVTGTAWRGKMRDGQTKTPGSRAAVAVPDSLAPMVESWRANSRNTSPDALVFPSLARRAPTPMRPENFLRRRIKPLALAAGIPAPLVNFQTLRRTFATVAQHKGSVKDVQAHLRHSKPDMTAGVYMQAVPESVREMVNAVAAGILGGAKRACKASKRRRR